MEVIPQRETASRVKKAGSEQNSKVVIQWLKLVRQDSDATVTAHLQAAFSRKKKFIDYLIVRLILFLKGSRTQIKYK
jgi:hypothetical protein